MKMGIAMASTCVVLFGPTIFGFNTLPTVTLGLIWFPSIEFISVLTKKQKWITIGRLVLSVPLVLMA